MLTLRDQELAKDMLIHLRFYDLHTCTYSIERLGPCSGPDAPFHQDDAVDTQSNPVCSLLRVESWPVVTFREVLFIYLFGGFVPAWLG